MAVRPQVKNGECDHATEEQCPHYDKADRLTKKYSPRVLFRAEISDFEVMPAARTRRGSQTPTAIRYRANQNALVGIFGNLALLTKSEGRSLEFPLPGPMVYSHTVWYSNNVWRDDDNVRKALTDALKKAGIIIEDNAHVIVGADRTRTRLGAGRDGFVLELREDSGEDLE